MADSNKYQVFKILGDLYRNEKYFENGPKDQEFQGYLIEKKLIDKIKKENEYEKIKPLIEKETFENIKVLIPDKKEQIKEIIPKKYAYSNDLKKELNKYNRSFIIIKQEYMENLCNKIKSKGNEMIFKFENNSIFILFNENDKLNTGNNNGIIEKNKIDQNYNPTQRENPNVDIKFKKDLEILLRIFYYNKYLKEKENTSFQNLIYEKGEKVYLINNSWMEEYKSFFDYQYLEDYLEQKNEYSEEAIYKIMKDLPIEYIEKINAKNNFDKNKTFLYKKNKFEGKLDYFCNNHIINTKIYELLKESGYKVIESLIDSILYFIGNNRVFLFFQNKKDSNKYVDEIGIINEKSSIFIPEYLLELTENNISLEILNYFLKTDFFNLFKNQIINTIEIKDKSNKKIGNCFKLNNNNITKSIIVHKKNENNNAINSNEFDDDNTIKEIKQNPNTNDNKNENNNSGENNSLNNNSQHLNNENHKKGEMNNQPNQQGNNPSNSKFGGVTPTGGETNKYMTPINNITTGVDTTSGNGYTPKGNICNNIPEYTIENNNNNNDKYINGTNNINTTNITSIKTKLHGFMENQIKALISYYLFIKDLKEEVKQTGLNSNSKSTQCYLVDEKWMQNYLNIFLYKDIETILMNNFEKNVDTIYEKLDDDFLIKVRKLEKEKNGPIEISKCLSNFNKENFIESPKTEDIQKYYNLKFNIINEETYNYMNKTHYNLLSDLKAKEYLINEGRILIRIQDDSIQVQEILICNFVMVDNCYIQPVLLLKYNNNLIIGNDFADLKKESFIKFKDKRFSNDSKELIKTIGTGFEKIGKIYDLKNQDLIEEINNEIINNKKTNNYNVNNNTNNNIINNGNILSNNNLNNINEINNPNELLKERAEVEGKPKNEIIVEHILNNNLESTIEIKNFLKGKNSNLHNLDNNNNDNKTKIVLEEMENKKKFNETKKTHIEFVLRLLAFEDKLYAKIKKSNEFNTMDIIVENGYIINHQIIDKYKEFYNSQNLKQLISHDINLKSIYSKYKNNKEYISENFVNNFVNESFEKLPLDYITEINSKKYE